MSRVDSCRECHRTLTIKGRGLCSNCYEKARDRGVLHNYARTLPDRRDDVIRLAREGMSHREIGERLGISKNAVQLAMSRARRRGDLGPVPDALRWPAEPTPCAGVDTNLFVYHPAPDGRLSGPLRRLAVDALAYCDRCPLASRQWCIEQVRPQEAGYTGVAGGVAWASGRPVIVEPIGVAS